MLMNICMYIKVLIYMYLRKTEVEKLNFKSVTKRNNIGIQNNPDLQQYDRTDDANA